MAKSFEPDLLYPRATELDDGREIKVYQSEVGDVGCVIWDAAIVLAKFYEHISLTHSIDHDATYKLCSDDKIAAANFYSGINVTLNELQKVAQQCNDAQNRKTIIELGSGTGYVGIVAASLGAHVTITDLPDFVDLMKYNIEKNSVAIQDKGGQCNSQQLVWGTTQPTPTSVHDDGKVDLILLADCIYYEESLKPLVQSIIDLSNADTITICCHEDRTTDYKPRLQKEFFEEVRKHFSVIKIPTAQQHVTYSSDDIHIHILQLLESG